MIKIEKISEDNFYDVIKLNVKESQKQYIATNVQSLAECFLYKDNNDVFPFAIKYNHDVVGFLMLYTDDEEPDTITIWRLMIDENHQSKGIANEVVMILEDHLEKKFTFKELYTSYDPTNISSVKLFKKRKFKEVKTNSHNEVVAVKILNNH